MNVRRLLSIAALFVAVPFSVLAQSTPAKPATPPPPAKAAAVTSAAAGTSNGALLDLNTASADDLKKLPGIGDAYSKRIVDGRPYAVKTQLVSRGILPKATYDGISNQVIAKHAATKK